MKKLISKAGRAIALQTVIFASFFAMLGTPAFAGDKIETLGATMPQQPKPLWVEQTADDAKVAEDARRDPNKYCTQCHESANATGKPFHHSGKHFQKEAKSPNNGEQVTCVSCHGNISENHRKGAKDVVRFAPVDVETGKVKGNAENPDVVRSVHEQNQVCTACHTEDKLRKAFWAHDTHANKLSCVNCHELHPEKEPMKGIAEKDRIKLCTDCHTKVHARQEKAKLDAKETK